MAVGHARIESEGTHACVRHTANVFVPTPFGCGPVDTVVNLLSAGPSQLSLLLIATETGAHTCVFQANSRYSYQQGKEIRIRDLEEALFCCPSTRCLFLHLSCCKII